MQELLDVEQNNFNQHQAFHFSDYFTRLQLVSVTSVTFDGDAGHVCVFDVTVEIDFHVDDVFFVEMTLENVN